MGGLRHGQGLDFYFGPLPPKFEGAFQIAWGCASTPYVEDIWTIDTRVDTELHDSILQGGFLAIIDLVS